MEVAAGTAVQFIIRHGAGFSACVTSKKSQHTLCLRSGLPIPAPRWLTARLPPEPLDGELWLARGRFDALSAVVRRQHPVDADWAAVRFMVFELPHGDGNFAARAARIGSMVRRVGWLPLVAVEQFRLDSRYALARRLDAVVRDGGEGLVLHRADAPWGAGRDGTLLTRVRKHSVNPYRA